MKILVGKASGFCVGVERAVQTALNLQEDSVCTYGELIHNPYIINKLRAKGICPIDRISDMTANTVIIRSHGATKADFEQLENLGKKVIDCTCVFVKRVQKAVEEYYRKGYKIVIIGSANHPEIIGTNGWCENSALIIDDVNKIYDLNSYEKVCIVVQTTYSVVKFAQIIKNIITDKCKTVEVFNTICYTTNERQKEAEELSKQCDAMIVVGGKSSANTTKLYELCQNYCKNVYFVEDSNDVQLTKLKKYNLIGIVAGASTPRELIEEVFLKMADDIQVMEAEKAFMEQVVDNIPEKKRYRIGQVVKATISLVSEDGISVMLPAQKSEIVIDKGEIGLEGNFNLEDYKMGEEIEVAVLALQPKLQLSIKAITLQKQTEEEIDKIAQGEEFSMQFGASNKGGLIGNLGAYSVFVPASEIRIGYVENIATYVGKQLRLVVKDIDRKKKKIVASQKDILLKEKEAKKAVKEQKEAEFLQSLIIGDVVKGKVVRTANFGVFVSVNGFDCLAHKTDLSWQRINNCEEAVVIGETYDFKVLKVDAETKRVSLGLRQMQEHPWELAATKYAVGEVVKGIVVRFAKFGAFVEVEKGIEGLVHVSQITYDWIENVENVLQIGQEIEAKIIELDCVAKKMTLSIKALLPEPERTFVENDGDQFKKPRNTDKFKRDSAPRQPRETKKDRPAPRARETVSADWISESTSGTSIGELLNGLFDNIDKE